MVMNLEQRPKRPPTGSRSTSIKGQLRRKNILFQQVTLQIVQGGPSLYNGTLWPLHFRLIKSKRSRTKTDAHKNRIRVTPRTMGALRQDGGRQTPLKANEFLRTHSRRTADSAQ